MKNVTIQAFQGDVMFRKRTAPIPTDAKQQATEEIIVAHSETGHHHVAEATMDPRLSFLSVPKYADIVHKRDFDTHETIRLDAGDWDVVRQKEWFPEGVRTVAD